MESRVRCAFTDCTPAHGKLQCSLSTDDGNCRWCPRHNEVRRKVYSGYKSSHKALDALPEVSISLQELNKCGSYETVKGWCVGLRKKLKLLRRCIGGRTYFTERFFGNDEDLGHETFRLNLEQQSAETESLLEHVENRAYLLWVGSQNAAWIIDDTDPSEEEEICNPFGEESLSKPKKPVPFEEIEDEEDPVDVAIREKRTEIWEKFATRLARYCAPTESRFYNERLDVIFACIARAVIKDPKLMMVAQGYGHAYSMLSDPELDLLTVEKLWKAIKELRVDEVRAAVEDVCSPSRDTGDYVVVFGNRVYKDLSKAGLPFRGWGHMTAIYPCYSCVRKVCKTVDELVVFTRYVHLTGSVLSQSLTRYQFDYHKFNALAFCGFLPNTIKEQKPRLTTKRCNTSNRSFWSEMKINNTLSVGLSLTDPKTNDFVNACFRDPQFMVLCRKGPNKPIVRNKKNLVGLEIRQSSTRAGLKSVPWEPHTLSYIQNEALEDAKPIIWAEKRIDDCFQVVIVDGGDGDMNDFIDHLVDIWEKIYNVDELGPLIIASTEPYKEDFDLGQNGLIDNTQLDTVKAYKALWQRDPSNKKVDDELKNVVAYYPYGSANH